MFKKILLGCIAMVCASGIFCGAVNAEKKQVEADGEYLMGDNDTPNQAKEHALDDAKKSALEKVAVFIESSNIVEDYQLVKQQIASYTGGRLQIESKNYEWSERVCKVHIVATVDIDEDVIRNLKPEPEVVPINPNPGLFEYPESGKNSIYDPPARTFFDVEEYNGHYYAVVDEGMDWRDADVYCRNHGGHLATINSNAEQKFVQALVLKNGNRNSYWLGGYQSVVKADKWYWVDDTPFEYTNWAVEQPDNLRETALMMYRNPNPLSDSSLGEWNDLQANGTYANESFFGLNNFGLVIEWESRELVQYQ